MINQNAREEIIRCAAEYQRQLAEICADETLSPLGKRRKMEALHSRTKQDIDSLRRQMQGATYLPRQSLKRSLFGLPANASVSDAISYRDAVDRAARVRRPDELGELMERAASAGDEMLLRAAAGHAWTNSRNALAGEGWGALVAEYCDQNPAAGQSLDALVGLAQSRTAASSEQIEREINRPPELNRAEAAFLEASEGVAAGSPMRRVCGSVDGGV